MFITNNCTLFHLWRKENLVKHQKLSKYDNHGCSSYVVLLEKLCKPAMKSAQEGLLCIVVYKNLNSREPYFKPKSFKLGETNR